MRPSVLLSTIISVWLFVAMPAREGGSPTDVKSVDALFRSAKQAIDRADPAILGRAGRLDPGQHVVVCFTAPEDGQLGVERTIGLSGAGLGAQGTW